MICLKVGRARTVFHTVCVLGILLGLGASVQAKPKLRPVALISAIGFQDADNFGQQPTQVDVMSGVSALDGVWSPQDVTPVGDATYDYYATGQSDAWLDAISLEFENPKLHEGLGLLRVYVQKADYINPNWEALKLLPGLFNPDYQDSNPIGIDINHGGILPDNSTYGWYDILFDTNINPDYFLPNGNLALTLRLWNLRVDAIEQMEAVMGDVTLDGFVNDDDLSVFLANWNTGNLWTEGDLNIDWAVDDDDLSLLLANWNEGTPPPMAGAVPEPASAALLLLGFSTLLKRRKMR